MKTLFTKISTGLLVISAATCFSQNECCGIYLNPNDYTANKLSYPADCERLSKYKITTDPVFQPDKIAIRQNGVTYRVPKDSIYAVKNCDGSIIRMYGSSEYPLLNPEESIMIYKVLGGSESNDGFNKTKYYFSKDAQGKIQNLTIANIKAAFSGNRKFLDLVDREFHSDAELSAYDDINKKMKINSVLEKSISK
jgi:hypothetical protein